MPLGSVMRAFAIGEVVESKSPAFAVGDLVQVRCRPPTSSPDRK